MAEIYTKQHKGVALYCGSAPCVFSDLEEAKQLYPKAPVYGANFTGSMIPEIEHIWTQHGELAHKYREDAGRKIYVHARFCTKLDRKGMAELKFQRHLYENIDYVWPELDWVAGSSGVAGAYWLRHGMGYSKVVLCGVPLSIDNTEYHDRYPGKRRNNGRKCNEKSNFENWIGILQNNVGPRTEGIYSMSGMTRKILGGPDGIR